MIKSLILSSVFKTTNSISISNIIFSIVFIDIDKLFHEDTRRTKLSEYSKERLELFFQDSTYNDQEKVVRILYKHNRKDLLFLISKGFGVSLRQFQFESPLSFDSEEDEVHIEIPEEDIEDDLSSLL